METIQIIEIIGGILFGGGMLELIKWLSTRKSVKKAAELENKAKEAEIKTVATTTVIDEWEKITAQHERDLEYYRSLITDRDAIIAEKDLKINELKDQLNCLTSSITQAQMIRCDKIACPDRIPPFGYKKINFRTGEIED